ncbi:MAG: Cof-type HAD-IIB family hydrolase [Lacrimispora sp.]|uniref:Cof-type HAD-IIB family hydrolase n=1 Tax=Lacrimispora sp. TaxID=2719234 RepID=UPI0039E4B606
MSIRLIASDMDGTLLNPKARISEANIEAIRKLEQTGTEFLICTGREYHDAKAFMEAAGITCGYICLSGAAVYDKTGQAHKKIPLTPENAADVERIFNSYSITMDILTSHGRYSTSSREQKAKSVSSFLSRRTSSAAELEQSIRQYLDTVTFIESLESLPEHVTVFKVCGNDILSETVMEMKEAFSHHPELAAASSFPTNIELTNADAQKGIALKAYADLRGISLDDVMTLGDSDNDSSMFTPEFGWTVAMANAMPCIRDAAKYHTKSNEEDGVAWAIEQFVFGQKPEKRS